MLRLFCAKGWTYGASGWGDIWGWLHCLALLRFQGRVEWLQLHHLSSALGGYRKQLPLCRERLGWYLLSCGSAQPVPSLWKRGKLQADRHTYGLLHFKACSCCEIKKLQFSSRLPAHTTHCCTPSPQKPLNTLPTTSQDLQSDLFPLVSLEVCN